MDLQKFTEKKIPKLTEAQESFVVSRFIAGESVQRIARDFLEFFPHFNGAVDKAKCEQVIRARCCHWKDPKTPQYKIIWKAILHRSDDTTDILFTHQRYRDHLRQNNFDQIKDINDSVKDKKQAKIQIDCVLVLQKILDDYDKREATRRKLYESAEVH